VYSSPAVADGIVCWGSYTGWFYGVSAATGRILWRLDTGGPISGAAVIVDGVAYVGSLSHRIFGVNLRTGQRLVTFPHGQYVPVSGNGMRLLFNGYSRIYAVQPRSPRHRRHAR
jgi:outer membrane protein assembly factor BamB